MQIYFIITQIFLFRFETNSISFPVQLFAIRGRQARFQQTFSPISMFYNQSLNTQINEFQERTFSLTYKDITSTFTIHQRNIPRLAIEMNKETEHPYNLTNDHSFRKIQC